MLNPLKMNPFLVRKVVIDGMACQRKVVIDGMACQLPSSYEPQRLDSSILVQDLHGFSKAEPLFDS